MSTETTRYGDGRVERDLAVAEGALARLEAELRAAGRDVETLKGDSAESLLYTLLASRDERLRREREAFLRDRSRHETLTRRVDALRRGLAEAGSPRTALTPARAA
ncbi:MAG TPA: hypothetical protein VF263_00625 [Longimicrobiaceae bacterium]